MTLPEDTTFRRGDDAESDPGDPIGRAGNARTVVLLLLLLHVAMAVAMALHLTRPPTPAAVVFFVTVLTGYAAALTFACFTAVTPTPSARRRIFAIWSPVLAAAALWAPSFAWGRAEEEPWAWLAGFSVAILPIITPRWGAVAIAAGAACACALGALVYNESVIRHVTILAICTGMVLLMVRVVVWLLRLLTAAEATRALEAQLAVTQERLRMSRELHDTLGHRLGVIALEAELAAGLFDSDPAQARTHSQRIQHLAATTLREARRAVVGETVTDLATQVGSARLVLESAGIDLTVDLDNGPRDLSPTQSRLCAAVVREGVTNVLRHTDATTVHISLAVHATGLELTLRNNQRAGGRTGPAFPTDAGGTGLLGLAARCAGAGGELTYGPDPDGGFHVAVHLPHRAPPPGSTPHGLRQPVNPAQRNKLTTAGGEG